METVDQSPELHLEEIQLRSSDPADMETPGQGLAAASPETPGVKNGHTPSPTLESETERTSTAWRVVHYILCVLNLATTSAKTSVENTDVANADILEEKPATMSAGTSGGKLTEANPGTSGGKSAEDERILLLTEGTKKTPTARRVVYYVLCVLTVVAVWGVALLPSVLTYSILRSPVQAPLAEAYTVNLTNTTPNCSIYTEDTGNSSFDSSGILSPNQSLLAAESRPRNESAAVGSNCSRECSDGFYLHQELGSCRPLCHVWHVTPPTTQQLAIAIGSPCLATIFIAVDLVIIALQWRMFTFSSFLPVIMIFDISVIVLLATLAHIQTWFCSSVDLIDSVLNASPYCTLSGVCYSYFLNQLPLWAIFYMALLLWAVVSPFKYQSFKNDGYLKYIYAAMVIVGVLLPCVPMGVNVGFGYGILSFSPMVCLVAVQDVGFFTDGLFEGFEVAILGTLQALVVLVLVKHAIKKTKRGNEALRVSRAQLKILGLLLYILLLNIINSALFASVSATVNSRRQLFQDYLRCEAAGRQAECSTSELLNVLQTSKNLVMAVVFVSSLYPAFLLPFIVNVKELKKSCKRICSSLKTSCINNE